MYIYLHSIQGSVHMSGAGVRSVYVHVCLQCIQCIHMGPLYATPLPPTFDLCTQDQAAPADDYATETAS